MRPSSSRPTSAIVDRRAVADNVRILSDLASPASMCAVVKADGYGHGSIVAALAALEGGAVRLAVATVDEALALRGGDVDAPIMLLSEPPVSTIPVLVANAIEPTVYTRDFVEALHDASVPVPLHLKVNTGMNRVGVARDQAVSLAHEIREAGLTLATTYTHLAVADEVDRSFTETQLSRFSEVLAELSDADIDPGIRHAANSAATMAYPEARFDMVRCGIAIYGIAPSTVLADQLPLRPALSLRSHVSFVKVIAAGDAVSYGQRYRADEPTVIATVPIGYADGMPRRLSAVGGEVLIGGRRRPLAGTVTMDQITVDCGSPEQADLVKPGDEVVLLGPQGGEQIFAEDWAEMLDTIGYEIVCGISGRVPRIVE